METVVSFMRVKQSEGGGEVASPLPTMTPTVNYCMFTATDVDHMLRRRRRLLDYSLWSLTRSLQSLLQWMAFIAAFMNFITSAISIIHYAQFWSDSIHLNRPRSDSDPIIIRSLSA